MTARQWLGLALGLVGVYFVVQGRIEGEGTLLAWIAATVALIGITLGTLYQKQFGGGIEWRTGFLVQYIACTALFALAALLFETREVQWSAPFLVAVAYLVLVLSLGAIWLFYFLIRRTTTTRVVSLLYLMPPLTALMSWAMFGERLAPAAHVHRHRTNGQTAAGDFPITCVCDRARIHRHDDIADKKMFGGRPA